MKIDWANDFFFLKILCFESNLHIETITFEEKNETHTHTHGTNASSRLIKWNIICTFAQTKLLLFKHTNFPLYIFRMWCGSKKNDLFTRLPPNEPFIQNEMNHKFTKCAFKLIHTHTHTHILYSNTIVAIKLAIVLCIS